MRVLIKGYYGAGNLGDDVLACVAYRAVTEVQPAAEVVVEAISDDYLRDDFGIRNITAPTQPRADDIVVLGGGGQFYDFAGGNSLARTLEPVLAALGARPIGAAYELARRVRGSGARRWGAHNIAIGLGIGPYASGSLNRIVAAAILAHFDGIAVRDPESLAICRAWGLGDRTRQFTDLAFLRRLWMPAPIARDGVEGVGVVIRDWKHAPVRNSYLDGIRTCIERLRAAGTPVTLISLDERADAKVLATMPQDVPRLTWDPRRMSLGEFCSGLASHRLVISARAHGAILGACVGVPAVCVGIEPKLRAVAAMLGTSATTWESPFDPDALQATVGAYLRDEGARARVQADVERNERVAEEGLVWLGELLSRIRTQVA